MDHSERMDRVYRFQTPFYDLTRRLFLPGRDRLLRSIAPRPGERVLEVGCGTARNLVRLARVYKEARYFGLDVSSEMLDAARGKVGRRGLSGTIELRQARAEDLSSGLFGLSEGERFDFVFFSYSLSMMEDPLAALDAALGALAPGGRLGVVDFWDLAGWPAPLRRALRHWLALFQVAFRPEVMERIEPMAREGRMTVEPVWRRYAFMASTTIDGQ